MDVEEKIRFDGLCRWVHNKLRLTDSQAHLDMVERSLRLGVAPSRCKECGDVLGLIQRLGIGYCTNKTCSHKYRYFIVDAFQAYSTYMRLTKRDDGESLYDAFWFIFYEECQR